MTTDLFRNREESERVERNELVKLMLVARCRAGVELGSMASAGTAVDNAFKIADAYIAKSRRQA